MQLLAQAKQQRQATISQLVIADKNQAQGKDTKLSKLEKNQKVDNTVKDCTKDRVFWI